MKLTGEQIAALEVLLGAFAGSADSDPWVDAAHAPVPQRAIRDAVRRGELRASRVAKKLLIRRSELDRWIESHAVAAPKPTAPASSLLDRLGTRKAANG